MCDSSYSEPEEIIVLKLILLQWFISYLQEWGVSYQYLIISQPIDVGRKSKQQRRLKSHLIIVHFYFISDQFHINRSRFSLVFTTYVQFCTHNVVLFFAYSTANFYLSSKISPTCQSTAYQPLNKSSTSNRAKGSITASIIFKQCFGF